MIFKFLVLSLLSISLIHASNPYNNICSNPNTPNTSINSSDTINSNINNTVSAPKKPSGLDVLFAAVFAQPEMKKYQNKDKKEELILSVKHLEIDPLSRVNLDDRRLTIFNSICNCCLKTSGVIQSEPGVFDWNYVEAFNWPDNISKTDISSWDDEVLVILDIVIRSGLLKFRQKPTTIMKASEKFVIGNIDCGSVLKSDSYDIVNNGDSEFEPSSFSSFEYECEIEESPIKPALVRSKSKKTPAPTKFKKQTPASKSKKQTSASKSKSKSKSNSIPISIDSEEEVDSEKRENVLNEALKIYRNQTGNPSAKEIDWSLSKVYYLENHLLPFSTSFESKADILKLKKLMKNKYFGFHKKSNIHSRQISTFERLYKLYAEAADDEADEYFIKWDHVLIEGWPEGLIRSYCRWKCNDLKILEDLLDEDGITFHFIGKVLGKNKKVSAETESAEPKRAHFLLSFDQFAEAEDETTKSSGSKRSLESESELDKRAKLEDSNDLSESDKITKEIELLTENYTFSLNNYPPDSLEYEIITEMINCTTLLIHEGAKIGFEKINQFLTDFSEIFEELHFNGNNINLRNNFEIKRLEFQALINN